MGQICNSPETDRFHASNESPYAAEQLIDIEAPGQLEAYLRGQGYLQPNEYVHCLPLAGGVSNRTMLVQRSNGEDWVVKQALQKLRVAVDWFSSPLRIHREALGLRTAAALLPAGAVPIVHFEDWHHHLLAMSAVPEPHVNWKSILLQGDLREDHVRQFATILSALHRRSAEQSERFAGEFADRSFFEALRLEPYYGYTATQVPEAASFLNELIITTRQRRYVVVHGDFSPKNVLIHNGQLILLDYEVIHWGDPAFDLGFSLTHFLSKAHYLPESRAGFASAAIGYWEHYRAMIGDVAWSATLEQQAVRHTLACLLARVAGRSPLEYLSAEQRKAQRCAVGALLAELPPTISSFVERFIDQLP